MSYIKSRQISAYPVVNRNPDVSGDVYGRHTSEETLTGIVNKFMDTDGFVITNQYVPNSNPPVAEFALLNPFRFNIYGYYFKVSTLQAILDLFLNPDKTTKLAYGNVVYAGIELITHGQWHELNSGDKSGATGNDEFGNVVAPNDDSWEYRAVNFDYVEKEADLPKSTSTKFYIPLFKYVGPDSDYNWNNTNCTVPDHYYIRFKGNSFTLDTIDGGNFDEIE